MRVSKGGVMGGGERDVYIFNIHSSIMLRFNLLAITDIYLLLINVRLLRNLHTDIPPSCKN